MISLAYVQTLSLIMLESRIASRSLLTYTSVANISIEVKWVSLIYVSHCVTIFLHHMITVTTLLWDAWNIEHILNHDVSREEVEEACHNQEVIYDSYRRRYC